MFDAFLEQSVSGKQLDRIRFNHAWNLLCGQDALGMYFDYLQSNSDSDFDGILFALFAINRRVPIPELQEIFGKAKSVVKEIVTSERWPETLQTLQKNCAGIFSCDFFHRFNVFQN